MKAVGVKVWVVLATTRLVRQARQQGLGSGAPCSTLLRAPGLCAPLVSPLPVSPLPVTAACHHCLCHRRLCHSRATALRSACPHLGCDDTG